MEPTQAKDMVAAEPDFHLRDLYDAIERRDAPEWRLEVQVMPFEEAAAYRFINQPRGDVNSYSKDGAMRYRHAGDQPVYAPNS